MVSESRSVLLSNLGLRASFYQGDTVLSGLFTAGNTAPIVLSDFALDDFLAVWSFLSAGVDLIITVTLVLVLRSEQRGLHRSTDDILQQWVEPAELFLHPGG